jgi:hypothetical protein
MAFRRGGGGDRRRLAGLQLRQEMGGELRGWHRFRPSSSSLSLMAEPRIPARARSCFPLQRSQSQDTTGNTDRAASPRRTCGLSGVRPGPRLSASYSPRPTPRSLPARPKPRTPDVRVVPEPGTVCGFQLKSADCPMSRTWTMRSGLSLSSVVRAVLTTPVANPGGGFLLWSGRGIRGETGVERSVAYSTAANHKHTQNRNCFDPFGQLKKIAPRCLQRTAGLPIIGTVQMGCVPPFTQNMRGSISARRSVSPP